MKKIIVQYQKIQWLPTCSVLYCMQGENTNTTIITSDGTTAASGVRFWLAEEFTTWSSVTSNAEAVIIIPWPHGR